MPLSELEKQLRLVARERIARGELPDHSPSRTWGGDGSEQPCALCDKLIRRENIELEVEATVDGALRVFHFHNFCHSLWQLECARADHIKKHP